MSKISQNAYPIIDVARRRWSPVSFDSRPVEEGKLRQLFEAARWAASCFNDQPWRFVVAPREDEAGFEAIFDTLVEANQVWAQHAPVLAVSVAAKRFERNGKPNRHGEYDTGMAAAHICLQATEVGLCVHQMAGFNASRARQNLGIPEEFEPMAVMAIGYIGDGEDLPEDVRKRDDGERERRGQGEFVYGTTWGKAADLVE